MQDLNKMDLNTLPVKELVAIHNKLAAGTRLKNWKQSKNRLVDRIRKLQNTTGAKHQSSQSSFTEDVPTADTIRETAINLLCAVAYYEDRTKKPGKDNVVKAKHSEARSVGLPYDEILQRIHRAFPDCNTTVACLRWYSVKIRVEEQGYENLKLPQRRPRVKPKK